MNIVDAVWKLPDAIDLCRLVEDKLAPLGAHVALGGGCMKLGYSHKDLDLFIYPHCLGGTPVSCEPLVEALRELGFAEFCNRGWSHTHTTGDRKDVRSSVWNGKRVDIFFLDFLK